MSGSILRNEHPRPDRHRKEWLSLNGEWDFEIDNSLSGKDRKFFERSSLDGKIIVPFSPESVLSGVNNVDFMYSVWYLKKITLPKEWNNKLVLLHIDACDYKTTVYVNGNEVGVHKGGYTSFQFDLTDFLNNDENIIIIHAEDDVHSGKQFSGKQTRKYNSFGCLYTRTTGIWQTVWLEAVNPAYVESYKAYPNIANGSVGLSVKVSSGAVGGKLTVKAFYDGALMGNATSQINGSSVQMSLQLKEKHLWEVGNGRLYDLVFQLEKENRIDVLDGYFGLREVSLTKEKGLQINGKTVFGRFVLDQGFYPDGIITAPSDDALENDVKSAMQCGFNGARLHQKVFEPRYLYHADKLGYMVWAESANWGFDHTRADNLVNCLPEWLEEIDRDFSHPSIIGWCPFNETWDMNGRRQCNEMLDSVYLVTKMIDTTRPVITDSGSYPTQYTDVHDVHDYEQNPEKFKSYYVDAEKGVIKDQLFRLDERRQVVKSWLPIFVSEYGGLKRSVCDENSWGYGETAKTEDEYFERLEGLTDVLLQNGSIFGFCYTQLTDVEQEQNGIMTYNRKFKFSPERYKRIFGKKAKIEEDNL